MTQETWQWAGLSSEGGPFVLVEERLFRDWPGAAGWAPALDVIEPPGALWSAADGVFCFFDPEDPGPMQVAWTSKRVLMIRWFEDGSPVVAPAQETTTAMIAAVDATRGDEEILGELVLHDGLVVVAWAAIGGADLRDDRDGMDLLVQTRPRRTLRFNDGGPSLTAIRLQPGRYRVSGMFDFYDEDHERGGTWVQLQRVAK